MTHPSSTRRGFLAGGGAAAALAAAGGETDAADAVRSLFATNRGPLADGDAVVVADGVATTLDPAGEGLQRAVDVAGDAGGGLVLLPPTTVDVRGPILLRSGVSIQGVRGASTLEVTTPRTDGLVFDPAVSDGGPPGFVADVSLDGFALVGPGSGVPTGAAVVDGGATRCRVGSLTVSGWRNAAWRERAGANSFDVSVDFLRVHDVDAGDADGVLELVGGGAPVRFDQVVVVPTDESTGRRSTVVRQRGGTRTFGSLNVGGTPGAILTGLPQGFTADVINWEPSAPAASPPHALFDLSIARPLTVGQLHVWKPVGYVYDCYRGGPTRLPVPYFRGEGRAERAVVRVQEPGSHPVLYDGRAAEVVGDDDAVRAVY